MWPFWLIFLIDISSFVFFFYFSWKKRFDFRLFWIEFSIVFNWILIFLLISTWKMMFWLFQTHIDVERKVLFQFCHEISSAWSVQSSNLHLHLNMKFHFHFSNSIVCWFLLCIVIFIKESRNNKRFFFFRHQIKHVLFTMTTICFWIQFQLEKKKNWHRFEFFIIYYYFVDFIFIFYFSFFSFSDLRLEHWHIWRSENWFLH